MIKAIHQWLIYYYWTFHLWLEDKKSKTVYMCSLNYNYDMDEDPCLIFPSLDKIRQDKTCLTGEFPCHIYELKIRKVRRVK